MKNTINPSLKIQAAALNAALFGNLKAHADAKLTGPIEWDATVKTAAKEFHHELGNAMQNEDGSKVSDEVLSEIDGVIRNNFDGQCLAVITYGGVSSLMDGTIAPVAS